MNELRQKMEVLKGGFNVAMLAEAFDCSVGRINELKCEPVEGQVYHKADINVDALYDFAIKHEINLNEIDFEAIAAAKKVAKVKIEFEVGSDTKFGKVTAIQKVGNQTVYVIMSENGLVLKNASELKGSM